MSLLIGENDTFDVECFFVENGTNIVFYEKKDAPEGHQHETFTFKKPSWVELRKMMSESLIPSGGTAILNPYTYMDLKLKYLLRKWTLKDGDGKPIKVTFEAIDKMHPSLSVYLSGKIDLILGPNEKT